MQYKLAAFSTSWKKYHEVVTDSGDREILIYLLICSSKLAYLKLITVLVYGNSSSKSHEQDNLNFQQLVSKISEFIFKRCSFAKNELFLRYFLKILFKVSEDFSYHTMELLCFCRTLPCIFAIILNTLSTDFLR